MIKIAICDDEKYFQTEIKQNIENYFREKGIAYEIDVYNAGTELVNLGTEVMKYSIIMLDVNMDEMDGIITAKKIREYSSSIYIVFITAFINYSLEGYKVDAIRYILKNNINFSESIYECMDSIIKRMNCTVLKKYFKFIEGEKTLLIDRIVYIESKLHKLEFHIMDETTKIYTMRSTLNEIEKDMMGLGFLRTHQSFLVNMKYIKEIEGNCVVLHNGHRIAIPRARFHDVKNSFIAYKGEF